MPGDVIPNIVPVVTGGDCSCLYNAISMTLTGDCQLKHELRLKTVKELISNWNVYDNEELNRYSAWDSFEEEVLESVKTDTYSSLTHMYSQSNLLGCGIVSIYPNTINPCVNINFFNKTIFPIMWTHMNNVNLAGCSRNHFVPFVKKYLLKQRRAKKLPSLFDSKKKIKIPEEITSKRTESNKTMVFERKETNENVSTSKENKDNVINNKETKDKAFNSKADDKISKKQRDHKETPF